MSPMDLPDLHSQAGSWPSSRVQRWCASLEGGVAPTSVNWWLGLRWRAQHLLYDPSLPAGVRLEWAATVLEVTRCMERFAGYDHWSAVIDEVHLRCYVISRLGANPHVEASDLAALVRVAASAIDLTPDLARELSSRWRDLPREQILMLRRHKNLLAPLALVADQLPDGPEADRIRALLPVEPDLP
jgi:hypothetical protein